MDSSTVVDYKIMLREVITVAQADELLVRWDALIREVYAANGVAEKVKEVLTPMQTDALYEAMAVNGVKIDESEVISTFLKGAREALGLLPRIRLRVARDFSESLWVEVSNLMITHLKYKVLLDVAVEPEILGGVIIENGGKYVDFSLRELLERNLESRLGRCDIDSHKLK